MRSGGRRRGTPRRGWRRTSTPPGGRRRATHRAELEPPSAESPAVEEPVAETEPELEAVSEVPEHLAESEPDRRPTPTADDAGETDEPTEPRAVRRAPLAPGPRLERRPRRGVVPAGFVVLLLAVAVASLAPADARGWWHVAPGLARYGSAVATTAAAALLAWRVGGRPVQSACVVGVLATLAVVVAESWALAGAAVASGVLLALLSVVTTRPATGLRLGVEVAVALLLGVAGAVVVAGYDVPLRELPLRTTVVGGSLLAGLGLAWWLGRGIAVPGRRACATVVVGVVVVALLVSYGWMIDAWGPAGLADWKASVGSWSRDTLGAVPGALVALVGVPALVWGVWRRRRRRLGWWVCAFGAVLPAGVATTGSDATTPLPELALATAYEVVIGAVIGAALIALDRHSGRAPVEVTDEPARPSALL